ncbi:MAG TPA: DNA alkylation repair protein [Thermoanaerobaculia bacterium]|nr:DNA alkylation repair protein [Thermoanaerobaculia bacterium]
MKASLRSARKRLREFADRERAKFSLRFFKTAPGQYGAGDRFLGIRVPDVRRVARELRSLTLDDVRALLASKWHEERLLALVILVQRYARGADSERQTIYEMYLASTDRINNWDLVDVSAPQIVGAHLVERERNVLYQLSRSNDVWQRRIAVIATQRFIRAGELDDTFALAALLVDDKHDLIHKAVGWMLREAGKRDRARLEEFLDEFARCMPRTMLRYAIERLPNPLRQKYLAA